MLKGIRKGFTLIELMIVVAIIAIIAAIAIPSLLRSRVSANEVAAVGILRTILNTEAVWRQNDMDGDGMPDNWTYDVYGFYACADGAANPFKAIDVALARADRAAGANPGGNRPYYAATTLPVPTPPPGGTAVPRTGYYLQAMTNTGLAAPEDLYQRDANGDGKLCENTTHFGFCASPDTYGASGVNTLIVNEEGVIYAKDNGNNTAVTIWPGASPASAGWRVTQ